MVENDRQLLADVFAGRLGELLRAGGIQEERHRVSAELPLRGPRVFQVPTGDHRRLLHQVPGLFPLPGRGGRLDELEVRRELAAVGRKKGVAVGRRARVDQLQLQESGALDQVLDPLRVVDTGKLYEDSIRPLPRDERLGDPELVDAVADRLDGLGDRVVLHLPASQVLQSEDPLAAGGRDRPVRQEPFHRLLELLLVGRRRHGDRERPFVRELHRSQGQALLPRLGLELLGGVVPFGLHGVGRVDLENQVDTAAQVQTELDAFPERFGQRRLARADPLPAGVGVSHGNVARDHPGDDEDDQYHPPANSLGQGFLLLLEKEPWSVYEKGPGEARKSG